MTADLSVLLDQLKARIEEGEWFGGHEAAALADVAAAAEKTRLLQTDVLGLPSVTPENLSSYAAALSALDAALARLRSVLAGEEEA